MIVELHLNRAAEFYPGWTPGHGGTRAQYAFKTKDGYQIERDEHVYVVTHTRKDGDVTVIECTEIPLANVRNAVHQPLRHEPNPPRPDEAKPVQPQGRRR